MHPILFKIGSYEFRSFTAAFMTATLLGLLLASKRGPARGVPGEKAVDATVWMVIAGALGARVVFILQELPYYLKHIDQLLSWKFEGLTSFGGPLFAIPVAVLYARKLKVRTRALTDTLAAPTLLGFAIGRIGCLLNGCCYGGACPANFPLGVRISPDSPVLHYPLQLVDSGLNLLGFFALLAIEKRGTIKPGQSAALFLIFHGLSRFIYEFGRAGVSSTYMIVGGKQLPITDAHAVALVLIAAGGYLFYRYRNAEPYEPYVEPKPVEATTQA